MIIRFLYECLLRLHPRRFRELFAEEMLSTFEEAAAERAMLPLFADGVVSLARQWMFRSEPRDPLAVSSSNTHAIDGVPVFYLEEESLPDVGSILSGGAVSILILVVVCVLVSSGGNRVLKALGGAFHKPEPSVHDVRTDGPGEHLTLVTTRSPVPVLAQPHDAIESQFGRHYLHLIRLLTALDADGNGIISAAEIANAPAVLQKLDANHDGKLTPEECGFRGSPPGIDFLTGNNSAAAEHRRQFLARTRPAFMRFHPVIAALDADHNGEISADEIRNAATALRTLDRNGDGRITADEYLPDPVENQLTVIMSRLDTNGDGKIVREERNNPFGEHFKELLDRADANQDGIVTEQELKDEIRRRADLNRDGVVTWGEMLRAQQSGAFGAVAR
jgi:hypothetical protein